MFGIQTHKSTYKPYTTVSPPHFTTKKHRQNKQKNVLI